MKLSVPIIALVFLVILSCSDDSIVPISLVGKWGWVKSEGGFTGKTEFSPESTGHQVLLVLKADHTYMMIDNQDTVQNSAYTVSRQRSIFSGELDDVIRLYNKDIIAGSHGQDSTVVSYMEYIYSVDDNTLTLSEQAYDGFTWIYSRNGCCPTD